MFEPDLSDYARAVYEYFVERRGKGVALSSADTHVLLGWEDTEVPLHVVTMGIDRAFDRKAEPPKSLKECKRFVTHEWKAWRMSDPIEDDDAPASRTESVSRESPTVKAPERPLEERLSAAALGITHPAVRAALESIAAEIAGIRAAQGSVPASIAAVVDQGIVETLRPELNPEECAAMELHIEAALQTRLRQSPMSPAGQAQFRIRAAREWLEDSYGPWEI